MMSQRLVTVLQVAGAALGIPAAAAGSYTAYQTFFSSEAACHRLRTNIVAIMERHIAADAKHALLRKDVTEFERTCGESDPDARSIFQAALQDAERPAARAARSPTLAAVAEPTAQLARKQPLGIFGTAGSGEQHGWVAISRKDKDAGAWVVNFDGYAISEKTLPPPGTVLTAQRIMPVWSELQSGQTNDQSKLQSRLPAGACVRVLAMRAGTVRLWAEVAPSPCS